MSTSEIKNEIQNVLDKVPESVLRDILSYLKHVQTKTKNQVETSKHLKKILKEDKELLDKLAQ